MGTLWVNATSNKTTGKIEVNADSSTARTEFKEGGREAKPQCLGVRYREPRCWDNASLVVHGFSHWRNRRHEKQTRRHQVLMD